MDVIKIISHYKRHEIRSAHGIVYSPATVSEAFLIKASVAIVAVADIGVDW